MIKIKSKELLLIICTLIFWGCNNPTAINSVSNSSRNTIKVIDSSKNYTTHNQNIRDTNSSAPFIGKWVIKDYFFSKNPSAFNNQQAKGMLNKNVLTIYKNYLVEEMDSCLFNKIDISTVSTDSLLEDYKYERKDLKISSSSLRLLTFHNSDDPDNTKFNCLSLDDKLIITDSNLIININGTYFLLEKKQ